MKYLTFEEYLKGCQKKVNIQRYHQDIQYRSVLFHQYHNQYYEYCVDHHIQHQYDDLCFEVEQYEKRMQDYYYRLGDLLVDVIE